MSKALEGYRKYTMLNAASKKNPTRVILDVGCSDASYIEPLLRTGLEVMGLEKNLKFLRTAAKRYRTYANFKPILADAQHLPLRKSLDCVICGEIIEHLPKPRLFLRDVHRSMKNDGTLIITTPNSVGLQELGRRLLSRLRDVKQKLQGKKKKEETFHPSLFTYEALLRTLGIEGFHVLDVKSQGIGLNILLEKLKMHPFWPILEIRFSEKLPKQIQRGWIIVCKGASAGYK